MTNTIAVVIITSLREGQVTLATSWRTSWINSNGLAIFTLLPRRPDHESRQRVKPSMFSFYCRLPTRLSALHTVSFLPARACAPDNRHCYTARPYNSPLPQA